MKKLCLKLWILGLCFWGSKLISQNITAHNPLVYADVPDMSIIRVGNIYYMSSTTMHVNPGVPIMRSEDLVNWKLVSYAYDVLDDKNDELMLENDKNAYGRGSWASSLRYHNGTYYVSTFSGTTNKTYIFSTKDIEKGPWKRMEFEPSYHDHTLFFDDDGKIYLIWGSGQLSIVELKEDLSGVKPETRKVLIENASAPAGDNIMLPAEGSQLFKIHGKYYLFNIVWPRGGMRTVLIHKSDKIDGPYEGVMALQDKGVAQGGLIDTPDGKWYAYLFRDNGAVGRIPYLVPVEWENEWPVLGIDRKVPEMLDLPAQKSLIPGIVESDEFTRKKGDPALPLVWQWNHNPVDDFWSLSKRKGYLRLETSRVDKDFVQVRNMLTQRTIGPECSGSVAIEVSGMKKGDVAGLALFQKKYGIIGVSNEEEGKFIVMINSESGESEVIQKIPLTKNKVYFKAECDFTDRKDVGYFYYSFDGLNWNALGTPLHMQYTLPHFMGYRFALFNYATETTGGYVDFDYFRIKDHREEQ